MIDPTAAGSGGAGAGGHNDSVSTGESSIDWFRGVCLADEPTTDYGGPMESRARRWLLGVLLVLMMALAVVAARGSGLTGEPLPAPSSAAELPAEEVAPGGGSPPPLTAEADEPELRESPLIRWLGNMMTALLLLLAGGTVVWLLYYAGHYLLTERVQRRVILEVPASQPGGGMVLEELRDVIRASLADLDAGDDPRRVVIACWLRLERLAAAAGAHRLVADTPTDLVERLLAAHQVDDRALRQLADAYRLARYAPATISPEVVATAEEALRTIDGQLHVRRPVEPMR